MKSKEEIRLKWGCWKKDFVKNKDKIIIALFLLLAASFLNYMSGNYTSKIEGAYVEDIILDHFAPMNLGIIFVWGYVIIIAIFFIYPLIFKPNKLHVHIVMFSLLIFVRAIFISLTHLITPPTAIHAIFPWPLNHLRYENDLFFSGHTSVPFLGFLIIKNKIMKYFMLASSVIMAATVLLMHQHYSIDVFAAFFITYGVFKIGDSIFKEKLSS